MKLLTWYRLNVINPPIGQYPGNSLQEYLDTLTIRKRAREKTPSIEVIPVSNNENENPSIRPGFETADVWQSM